ncbi:hypothetical protein [Terasakiella sp.]|uniref:hypothetical protein n=1 Tax=Terasakiella sp. TaxID=2034861 RepID=UPI003AA8B96D
MKMGFSIGLTLMVLSACTPINIVDWNYDGGGGGGNSIVVPEFTYAKMLESRQLKKIRPAYIYPKYIENGSYWLSQDRYGSYGYLLFGDNSDRTLSTRKAVAKAFAAMYEKHEGYTRVTVPTQAIALLTVPLKEGKYSWDIQKLYSKRDINFFKSFLSSYDYAYSNELLNALNLKNKDIVVVFSPYPLDIKEADNFSYLKNEIATFDFSNLISCHADHLFQQIENIFTTNTKMSFLNVTVANVNETPIKASLLVPNIKEFKDEWLEGNPYSRFTSELTRFSKIFSAINKKQETCQEVSF